jgi:hypothetical protein
LAALLAVLGKQWLLYYSAAGERGTIEARGRERQRKFDGLLRWKFDTVIQMFPLLLQLALFLFSAALSIYLWTIHLSLAIIALSFTFFGFISYMSLLLSAAISPDCPFQTALPARVSRLIPHIEWTSADIEENMRQREDMRMREWDVHTSSYSGGVSANSRGATLFDPPLQSSPEISAVSWLLETSSDPLVVTSAAAAAVELQWPINVDLTTHLRRLRDTIMECVEYDHYGVLTIPECVEYDHDDVPAMLGSRELHSTIEFLKVRNGMERCLIECGQVYSLLWDGRIFWIINDDRLEQLRPYPELYNVAQILGGSTDLILDPRNPFAMKWAFRAIGLKTEGLKGLQNLLHQFQTKTIPSLDPGTFADYLFCIIAFLSNTNISDALRTDKR